MLFLTSLGCVCAGLLFSVWGHHSLPVFYYVLAVIFAIVYAAELIGDAIARRK
jgi:hypothetical protein